MKHFDSISIESLETRGNVVNFWACDVANFSKFSVSLLCWRRYTKPRGIDPAVDSCHMFAKTEHRRWCPLTDFVEEIREWSTSAT